MATAVLAILFFCLAKGNVMPCSIKKLLPAIILPLLSQAVAAIHTEPLNEINNKKIQIILAIIQVEKTKAFIKKYKIRRNNATTSDLIKEYKKQIRVLQRSLEHYNKA